MLGVPFGIGDVVAMGEQYERQAAEPLDGFDDVLRPAWRIDHRIAGLTLYQE